MSKEYRITKVEIKRERSIEMIITFIGTLPIPNLFKQIGYFFFAEKDGFVRFFSYLGPGGGYGGATFNITLEDGTTKQLIGPWSSRCSVMNSVGFTSSLEVTLLGPGPMSGAITVEFAKQLLEEFNLPYDLRRQPQDDIYGDVTYDFINKKGK